MEGVLARASVGARVSLERGGARVPVQWSPYLSKLPCVEYIRDPDTPGARVAAANCRVAPPSEKVPDLTGVWQLDLKRVNLPSVTRLRIQLPPVHTLFFILYIRLTYFCKAIGSSTRDVNLSAEGWVFCCFGFFFFFFAAANG